ncbi:MAG: hypothetical protein B7Z54_03745 [Sphingobacteriales bacterium 12-47-4]|nr:MAG: hypothetical protein B7Z54_03745 [Sphingobacteriales bacterium 12-47-4]
MARQALERGQVLPLRTVLEKVEREYQGQVLKVEFEHDDGRFIYEIRLLQKLVKQRKDSLEIYQQQQRADLAQKEEEEIAVIEKFLPQQMSVEELKTVIKELIAETGASSPADMGKVMGAATKKLAGKADGKTISAVVKELLSA